MQTGNHRYYETIFLSHSSSDREVVEKFFQKLKRTELRVWFDKFDIIPGEVIVERINEGIEQSQILLLFVSEHSLRSSWVKYEWTNFISRKLNEGRSVYLLPIIIGGVEPPPSIRTFRFVRVDPLEMGQAIKETAAAIKQLVRKVAEERRGYQTLQVIDREKLIDREMTIVERHITIRTLGDAPLEMDFHQWQTNPGESSVVRTSVVDNSTQQIIPSVLTVIEQTPTSFHLSNRFKPSRKHQVITCFFELACKQYHADIFRLGYSQIDFLIRYPMEKYAFILEVPRKPGYEGIVVEAMRKNRRVAVRAEDSIMDRIFRFQLRDLLPMEELTIVTRKREEGI